MAERWWETRAVTAVTAVGFILFGALWVATWGSEGNRWIWYFTYIPFFLCALALGTQWRRRKRLRSLPPPPE